MCVVSMVLDAYTIKPRDWWIQPLPNNVFDYTEEFKKAWDLAQQTELQKKIFELEELLQRAREYDKKMNQPDCELDEKRQALKKIADELGVEIKFL